MWSLSFVIISYSLCILTVSVYVCYYTATVGYDSFIAEVDRCMESVDIFMSLLFTMPTVYFLLLPSYSLLQNTSP